MISHKSLFCILPLHIGFQISKAPQKTRTQIYSKPLASAWIQGATMDTAVRPSFPISCSSSAQAPAECVLGGEAEEGILLKGPHCTPPQKRIQNGRGSENHRHIGEDPHVHLFTCDHGDTEARCVQATLRYTQTSSEVMLDSAAMAALRLTIKSSRIAVLPQQGKLLGKPRPNGSARSARPTEKRRHHHSKT